MPRPFTHILHFCRHIEVCSQYAVMALHGLVVVVAVYVPHPGMSLLCLSGVILLSLSTLFGIITLATPLATGRNEPLQTNLLSNRDMEFRAFELCVDSAGDTTCSRYSKAPTCCGMEGTYRSVAALLFMAMLCSFVGWVVAVFVLAKTAKRVTPDREALRADVAIRELVVRRATRRSRLSKVAGLLALLACVFCIAAVGVLMDSDAYDPDDWLSDSWVLIAPGAVSRRAGVGIVLAILNIFLTFAAFPFLALFQFGCVGCYIPSSKRRLASSTTNVVSPSQPVVVAAAGGSGAGAGGGARDPNDPRFGSKNTDGEAKAAEVTVL